MISRLNPLLNRLFVKQLIRKSGFNCRQLSSLESTNDESDVNSLYNEKKFEELSVDKYRSLITDPKVEAEVEKILNEYEYEKYTTLRVPTTITVEEMQDLLKLKEFQLRRNWISYLYKREVVRRRTVRKRKEHSEEYWSKKHEEYSKKNSPKTGIWSYDGKLEYGLWHNTLFSKIMRNSVNRLHSHRLRRAALFGPKLVIDLSFDKYMRLSECRLLAQQISLLYNWNRYKAQEPFALYFTNCDLNGPTVEAIQKRIPLANNPAQFLSELSPKSHLDMFPRERLVMLSPHAKEPMKSFNVDDIYVLGGFLDKSYHAPITLAKAKEEGIRCVSLPIDDYILWKTGSKYLCLNHILQILHDLNMTGDWAKSLRDNIPKRKQKTPEEVEYEDMLREQKYKRFQKRIKDNFNTDMRNKY